MTECEICHMTLLKGERNKITLKKIVNNQVVTYNFNLCLYHQSEIVKTINSQISFTKYIEKYKVKNNGQ